MQSKAMQCNAMQCNAKQSKAMQCNAKQRNAMQCNAMQCNAILFKSSYLRLYWALSIDVILLFMLGPERDGLFLQLHYFSLCSSRTDLSSRPKCDKRNRRNCWMLQDSYVFMLTFLLAHLTSILSQINLVDLILWKDYLLKQAYFEWKSFFPLLKIDAYFA
jgi:hypothetical protein